MIFPLILACMLIAFFSFGSAAAFSDEGVSHPAGWVFLAAVAFLITVTAIVASESHDEDIAARYRQGQIDAANGKMKYVQQRNDDGEVVWVEKKDGK